MQIALNDEEVGTLVELLYESLPDIRQKITMTQDPEVREALKHRERVLHHLLNHLMSLSAPLAA